MKRGWLIAVCVLVVVAIGGYFAFSKFAIRHETLNLVDTARNRPVDVDIAVRWDNELKADAGYITMPVAIISHGNTVKYTEYSFLANVLAARGYFVASIQHDLPTDAPLMTVKGSPYVGRLPVYQRGEQNILFAIDQLKKIQPHADYDHLTLVGHSNGGDISMFFAKEHPDMVQRVVTLDNLRVPFVMHGPKILSFRSNDWKPDPGVVPDKAASKAAGIEVVQTDAQHVQMSDRGPDSVKEKIQATLDKFLGQNNASELRPSDAPPVVLDPSSGYGSHSDPNID
ncbi:MAG: alpha/beta fold hydrolase [Bradyrhizobium sp.]|uniref:alpha/beta fold hydrolase n=1 Tax=Bradyrhizobium sp. TaxID=376 RepID=UPI001215D4C8|nr:alpha/beta fold hydrolase [Bradyrhizobium sp.]THD63197.1 MAG: alpha/beta fold hydrolase [Bradyrhizobium sp.]